MKKEELKKQIELLVKDDEKNQETIIKQSQEIKRLNNIIKQYDKVSFIHEMELQKRIDKEIEILRGDKKVKEVIERCNWLVNKCEDKAITPDVKDDVSYLLEEIARLNNIINDFEEELESAVYVKEENTSLSHNTFLDINDTLKNVLERFRELKEGE